MLGAAAAAGACGSDEEGSLEDALRSLAPDSNTDEPPDIVFVCVDDLNDWPAPFEGPKPTAYPHNVLTPNMDLLATLGTVFQRAYCAAPICGASRSATMTGLPPHVSGVTELENILQPIEGFGPLLVDDFTTLPRLLKASGYVTRGAGKIFHNGGYNEYEKPGHYDGEAWDEYEIINNRAGCPQTFPDVGGPQVDAKVRPCAEDWPTLPDAQVANFGIEKLGEPHDGSPLFLALGFFKPHAPWEAPQSYYDMYPIESIKSIDPFVERLDQADLTLSGCTSLRDLKSSPDDGQWEGRTRAAIAGYLACITHTDHLLGEVISAVAQRSRRTLFVLWSDHGYFMGEKHGWKKPKLYERASRVPLIVLDTGNINGQSTNKIVSLNDVFPTVLDYAGIANPVGYGHSLRPLVEDGNAPWSQTSVLTTLNFRSAHRQHTKSHYNPDIDLCMKQRGITRCGEFTEQLCPSYGARMLGASHALRTERPGEQYRYIRYHDSGVFLKPGGVPYRELYDLAADPAERTNLLAPQNVTPAIEELASLLDAELDEKLDT